MCGLDDRQLGSTRSRSVASCAYRISFHSCTHVWKATDAPGFSALIASARAHLEPLELFGRLPERNEMLQRPSSEAEMLYLKDHPTA